MTNNGSPDRETPDIRQHRIATGLASIVDDMRAWRHDFHMYPETAFEEVRTSDKIAGLLGSFGIDVHRGMAGTGVVGTLAEGTGPRIMLRADIDALAMEERGDRGHRSRNAFKMHACGHDGHTATLLGAARFLAQTRNFKGTIFFVFQPAEENEGGGRQMVEEGLFSRYPAEKVFGMHNWPGIEAGHIATRKGPLMSAFSRFELCVRAATTHAAMPHRGGDSILASTAIVNALQSIVSRRVDPLDSAVVSVTQIHGGGTWNVIPEEVFIRGSIRHFKEDVGTMLRDGIADISDSTAKAFLASAKMEFFPGYPPLVNAAQETDDAVAAAMEAVGSERVITDVPPSSGSEDFAFLSREIPGCYVWIGNGKHCQFLHSPDYDFNDDILEIGARYWVTLAERLLPCAETRNQRGPRYGQ